jgi:tRNA (uracil-5-)-methyltransferase TRM9
MDPQTQDALLRVNRRFYEQVAFHFDATRQGWTPGLVAILPYFEAGAKERLTILDVGCGNGRFARLLAQEGFTATYTGVDGNAQLLQLARESVVDTAGIECRFIQADLADRNWVDALADRSDSGCDAGAFGRTDETPVFDVVLCTATIQHLPGYDLRLRLLRDFRRLSVGYTILSFWQFLSRERFRARLIDPQTVGIHPSALEPGDGLLPWRQGVEAIRYVHQVDEAELRLLAAEAGLSVLQIFREDGRREVVGKTQALPGLNLYAILN